MKKKIIFQKCNIHYIYFLLYILTYIIILIIDHYLELREFDNNVSDNVYYFLNIEILQIYTLNLSDFFAIILYLIRKKLSKSNNDNKNTENNLDNNSSENNDKKELIYNESNQTGAKFKTKQKLFYLFMIAAFDFLKNFVFVLYYIFFPKYENCSNPLDHSAIFEIIIQFVFSYLILKVHFYKLQHFSLYLNIIIFIIILAIDLVDILKFEIFEGFTYIFFPFQLIFYCLKAVYGKKVILYGYISIYILIIMKGAFKLIFVIVFSLIVLIVDKKIFIIFAEYFSILNIYY